VRFSTESIVKEKGPINLSCLHMYKLLQSTCFETYLIVILHFDSALGEGGCSLILAIQLCPASEGHVFL